MAANMKERWQTHNMIANNLAKERDLHGVFKSEPHISISKYLILVVSQL